MSDYPVLLHAAVDATDVPALAAFYRDLLGLHVRPGDEDDPGWQVLLDADGARVLALNHVRELRRATYPSDEVPKQLHLDFRVPDRESLERHRSRAEGLGATLVLDRTDDEDEPLYVLADPEGHPFCLLVG